MSCMKMRLPGGTGQNSGRSANFVASKLFSQHSIPHNKVLLVSSSKGDIYTILGGFECTKMFVVSI